MGIVLGGSESLRNIEYINDFPKFHDVGMAANIAFDFNGQIVRVYLSLQELKKMQKNLAGLRADIEISMEELDEKFDEKLKRMVDGI